MEIKTLDNNFTVIYDTINNVNIVSLGIFFKSGSKYELKYENGITHLIEHLLIKTNKIYSVNGARETIENLGGTINAFTTKEYMCIHIQILKDYFNTACKVLFNIVNSPDFNDEEAFYNEKKIIYNEIIKKSDNYWDICRKNLLESSLNNHSLSQDIIGKRSTLEKLMLEDVQAYYKNNFDTSNTLLCISGNITKENKNFAEDLFNHCINYRKKPFSKEIQPVTFTPSYSSEVKSVNQNYISIGIKFSGYGTHQDDLLKLTIINQILGKGATSKLNNRLREAKGLVYSIFSYSLIYKELGILLIECSTPKYNLEKSIIEHLHDELIYLGIHGLTHQELVKSILTIKTQLYKSLSVIHNRMLELGKMYILNINSPLLHYFQYNSSIDEIEELSNQDLDVINSYLKELFLSKHSVSTIKAEK